MIGALYSSSRPVLARPIVCLMSPVPSSNSSWLSCILSKLNRSKSLGPNKQKQPVNNVRSTHQFSIEITQRMAHRKITASRCEPFESERTTHSYRNDVYIFENIYIVCRYYVVHRALGPNFPNFLFTNGCGKWCLFCVQAIATVTVMKLTLSTESTKLSICWLSV